MKDRFAQIRSAIDIMRGRMPGALAMLKAKDVSVAIRHGADGSRVEVTYWFDKDMASAGNAYRACERLYEFDRKQ